MSCVTVNLGQDALVKEIFNLNVLFFPGKIKVIIIIIIIPIISGNQDYISNQYSFLLLVFFPNKLRVV